MSTELSVRPHTAVKDLETISDRAAKSRLFGMDRDQIFTLCLIAESEGLHPISALRRYHVIEGRPAMRADAMQAEFQRSGGRVEWIESTPQSCTAMFYHKEYAPKGFRVQVTFEEMDRAGITRGREGLKKNWKQFPRQMLRARVISEGVRAVNPSIVVGIYTPEEVQDFEPPRQVTARVVEPPAKVTPEVLYHNAQAAHEAAAKVPTIEESFPERAGSDPVREALVELEPAEVDTLKGWAREKVAAQTALYAPPAEENPVGGLPKSVGIDDYLLALTRSANDYWTNHLIKEGQEPKPLLTTFQLENHLANWLLENGKVAAGHFDGPSGKRNRVKVLNSLRACHKRDEVKFNELCVGYFATLMEEKSAELGIMSPDDDDDAGLDSAEEMEPEAAGVE